MGDDREGVPPVAAGPAHPGHGWVLPIPLLVVFGYAASVDVASIPAKVVGFQASRLAACLPAPLTVRDVAAVQDRSDACLTSTPGCCVSS